MLRRKDMKVFLNLMDSHHIAYADLLSHPPEGVSYLHPHLSGYYGRGQGGESPARRILKALYSPLPAVYYVRGAGDADVIHSTNNLMLLNNRPWVMDLEQAGGLLRFRPERYGSGIYRSMVAGLLGQENCRAILPWSKAARKSLEGYLRGHPRAGAILSKAEVVYPAMHVPAKKAQKPGGTFRFLFVGRLFYEKGGREALEAFALARRKTDCSLTYIGNVPEEFRRKYSGQVEFHEPKFNRGQMEEMFASHHALLFPTYMDTFGFVALEAMAAGLPVISTRLFCIPEVVEDGVSGVLLEPPVKWHDARCLYDRGRFPKWADFVRHISASDFSRFSRTIAGAMVSLASGPSDWKSLSASAAERIASGSFSIGERNRALAGIYARAAGKK